LGLSAGHTLEVFCDGVLVFSSTGNWLHPLFELEAYLESAPYNPAGLVAYDKIIGRAAALLMVRLGLGEVHARLLSRLGEEVLVHHGLQYTYDELVDRIACQTEELLVNELDPEPAYVLLRERAGL
jgi:hypothetical protein